MLHRKIRLVLIMLAHKRIIRMVRKNPVQSSLTILGAGIVIGALFRI